MTVLSRGFVGCIGLALVVAAACTVDGADHLPISPRGAAAALTVVGLLLAAWFLQSFVFAELPSQGKQREAALTDIYAFAYTFTLLSLALLAFPFGNLLNQGSLPDAGPIRLLRGCVVVDTSDAKTGGAGNRQAESAGVLPNADAASEPVSAPSGAAGRTSLAKPVTSSAGSSAKAAASGPKSNSSGPGAANGNAMKPDWPRGVPVCGGDALDVHTVLITIGGVIGKAQPPAARPADGEATSAYEVRDGFVVPLLMAVLALVGAVVNLMRRVPEFQKRTHADFAGTDKEKPLQPYEAREFVVFQILQLISAPFIAMVAFYVIAPQSLPSAIALAFVSGFFSEGVLLRIRALVEGPEKTPTEATSQPLGELEVGVAAGGVPQAGVLVTLTQMPGGKRVREATTDARGLVALKAIPVGKLRIDAKEPGPAGRVSAGAEIDVAAGQHQKVDLTL